MRYAKRFVRSRLHLMRIHFGGDRFRIECRRVATGRIDCGVIRRRRCEDVITVRVQRDGSLATARYPGGDGRRCRNRR